MSEVQTRPVARGRGSARGGRGGFSSRGGRTARGHATNGDKVDKTIDSSIDEDDEVVQLKKQYGSDVSTIKEMFPDWTDEDIVYALKETDGDLATAVGRITDGTISQWGEVSKTKKDRARSKVKEAAPTTAADTTASTRPSRGGRGGADSGRGGRGRGSERGRGGRGRGTAAPHTNGTRHKETADLSVPTTESTAWATKKVDEKPEPVEVKKADDAPAPAAPAPVAAAPPKKTWASMLKQTPPEKKPMVPKPADAPKPVVPVPVPVPAAEPVQAPTEPEPVAEPAPDTPQANEAPHVEKPAEEPEPAITPSKDELTETNLDLVPDVSNPPPTATQASTTASSWDPRSGATSSAPYSLHPTQTPTKAPASGFAATALKATATPRSASYQRRILDQEEAVRMPGNREVDRAAVQFGAFNLGDDDDVDGDREEPETRQPPQHSPVAHPRTALPPAPPAAEHHTPKAATAAPGLTSPNVQPAPAPQTTQSFNQYSRYGQDQTGQKYDAFSQQAPTTQGYEQPPAQPQQSAYSSAPSEYSQYYPTDQQRSAYQNYYGQYGQQGGQGAQDAASSQRSFSGYNGPQAEQTSGAQSQPRFATAGESQNSGHTTPNPTSQTQPQQPSQGSQPQAHPQQPHTQYPYSHPYFNNPYYSAYMNQFQGYGGSNYGMGPYGKAGMYSTPHQAYGMSPQNPYEHGVSPAGGFGQSALHGRDSALGGLGEYGRGASQQASQPLGGSGSFGMHDAFGRGSSYQGQGHNYNQQSAQPSTGDDLKPFGENAKSTNGPGPALSQTNRPGSATNNTSSQSGLPPPQSQQGYSGYPSHPGQHTLHGSQTGSQYGGLGGISSHQGGGQGHQNSQYGYGQQQGFGSYYGNNQPRGWGGNYGHN